MKNPTIENVLNHAQGYQENMTRFLQDLVRIPSVNGRETEQKVAERIVAEGQALGFESQLVAKEIQHPNALVKVGGGKRGFALIAHLDTVAEGSHADWDSPPFAGDIRDGRIYGRGTADNKAGIACGLYAMQVMRDLDMIDPAQMRVMLAGVVDEESGACSPLGVRYLLDQGCLKADAAIYAYASDIVCIGHRGLLRLEITTRGESVHAGLAPWHNQVKGVNAVTGLSEILVKLENIEIAADPVPGFEHLGFTITPGTQFSGGDYPSIVPNHATAMVDIRLLPGQTREAALQAVEKVIEEVKASRSGLGVETHLLVDIPGAAIPVDHELALTAQRYTKEIHGKAWEIRGAGPGNEGYMLIGGGNSNPMRVWADR